MEKTDKVHQVNMLSNDLEAIYHQAALKLGIPDSVLIVLYTVHDLGEGCRLCDICTTSGLSKQTINSAVRMLEKEGVLYLEAEGGRTKRVLLTEHGREYLNKTAGRLYKAECAAFQSWTQEEFARYLELMAKYNQCIRVEIEKMEDKTE